MITLIIFELGALIVRNLLLFSFWSSNSREFMITLIIFELGALIVRNLLLFSFWSSNYGNQPLPSHLQDLEALNSYKASNL